VDLRKNAEEDTISNKLEQITIVNSIYKPLKEKKINKQRG